MEGKLDREESLRRWNAEVEFRVSLIGVTVEESARGFSERTRSVAVVIEDENGHRFVGSQAFLEGRPSYDAVATFDCGVRID